MVFGFLLAGALIGYLIFSGLSGVIGISASPSPTPTATSTPVETSSTSTPIITPSPETPAASPSATPTPYPRPARMASPEYGMQAFLWWRPEVGWRDLDLIRDAGFGWVKQIFAWRDIEGAGKGAYDWSRTDRIVHDARERGLNLLVTVFNAPDWVGVGYPGGGPGRHNGYRDFADFLSSLSTRYRGQVRAYAIWNEPNLSREWGNNPPNPAEYVALLHVAYQAIKAADPGALVISAGLSPTGTFDATAMPDDAFLRRMYEAGAKPYFNVLGLHAPGYKAPPEMSPDEVADRPEYGGQRFFAFRHVEDMRRIMEEFGDGAKQVAILEFGWTSDPRPDSPYYWHAVSEETKADYLVRAYQFAQANWAPWIGLMSLIYITDADWTPDDEQYWWAITDPGYPQTQVRPAYERLKAMPK
ncbi:MAG: hypothetical protein HYZ68_00245 [Chloroflexi bacterium]|nr:hypothetical protein [Chloroflexota bacterium]